MTFLIEMVVDRGVDGDEFLQTSHAPEAEHRTLPSSKRQVGILGPVVQPTTKLEFFNSIGGGFNGSTQHLIFRKRWGVDYEVSSQDLLFS